MCDFGAENKSHVSTANIRIWKVQNLGETDMIVTYEDQKTPSYAWHLTKNCLCDGCDILRGGIFDHGV